MRTVPGPTNLSTVSRFLALATIDSGILALRREKSYSKISWVKPTPKEKRVRRTPPHNKNVTGKDFFNSVFEKRGARHLLKHFNFSKRITVGAKKRR